jgi:SAM-dependent methyltransferase
MLPVQLQGYIPNRMYSRGNDMSALDWSFTRIVNFVQKHVVPMMEKRLPKYAEPDAAFVERIRALGLRPEKMYLGAMVHEPWRSGLVMDDIESSPPSQVIECGAGNSTTCLLALGAKLGFGLTSLENHPDSIAYIRYLLEETPFARSFNTDTCGFTRFYKPDGCTYWWYDVDLAKLGKTFDFVLVDGPMSTMVGRGGALYRLWDYLAPGARIYVDDANRPHERKIIAEWKRDFPAIDVQYPAEVLARIVKP